MRGQSGIGDYLSTNSHSSIGQLSSSGRAVLTRRTIPLRPAIIPLPQGLDSESCLLTGNVRCVTVLNNAFSSRLIRRNKSYGSSQPASPITIWHLITDSSRRQLNHAMHGASYRTFTAHLLPILSQREKKRSIYSLENPFLDTPQSSEP